MRFKEFFLERFVDNSFGLLYQDPSPDEFWKHVVPNITENDPRKMDRLGAMFTPNHVYYFDRTEMKHTTCYYQFIQGKNKDNLDNIVPATITKKGFSYIIHPAYYTFKRLNFMGYNDVIPDRSKRETHIQTFLNKGGKNKIENIVNNHPHLSELKNRKPLGYTIKVDYEEGIR